MPVSNLLRIKEEYKSFKKLEIPDIFIKKSKIKLAFKMAWLMEILKICPEEQLLIKY